MRRKVVAAASDRVQQLPPPFLEELEGIKRSLEKGGRKVFDLSKFAISVPPENDAMEYSDDLNERIRNTFTGYLEESHGVKIDPSNEILLVPGGRAALQLLGAFFLDQSRLFFVPDPGYYFYRTLAVIYRSRMAKYSLYQRNDFLPNLSQFEQRDPKSLKILILNSPHNPTGAVYDQGFYSRLERVVIRENLLMFADSSYILSSPGNFRPPLFCQSRQRLNFGLEVFSLATNLCAPHLRLAAVVGLKKFIAPLSSLARTLGLCIPDSQLTDALGFLDRRETFQRHIERCRATILERTSTITNALISSGIEHYPVITSPFVWVRLKKGRTSLGFARGLLRRREVAIAPGSAFGEEGEGWVRISSNISADQLKEALDRFVSYYHPIRARLSVRRTK